MRIWRILSKLVRKLSAMDKPTSPLTADVFYGQHQMHIMHFLIVQFFSYFFVNDGTVYPFKTLATKLEIKVKRIICCVFV